MKVEMEGENDPSLGELVLGEEKIKLPNGGGKTKQQSGTTTWACLCGLHKSVEVAERTGPMMYKSNGGPGREKPGGVGRIVRRDPDGTFAVKYVLGGMESGIGLQFISCYVGATCPRVRAATSLPLTERPTARKDRGGSNCLKVQRKRSKVGVKMMTQSEGSMMGLQKYTEEKPTSSSKESGKKQQRQQNDQVTLPVGENHQFGTTPTLFKGGMGVPFGADGSHWQQPSMFSSALVLGGSQEQYHAAAIPDKPPPPTSSVNPQRRETLVGLLLGAFQTADCISRENLMTMVNAEADPHYGEDELDFILHELDIENCILLCEGNIYPV